MKTVQILLPDHLHEQLQKKAAEAGFDFPAYVLALLSESAAPSSYQPLPKSERSTEPATPQKTPAKERPAPNTLSPATPNPYSQQPGGTKGPQSDMEVVIRWDRINKGAPDTIRSTTAAATLMHVISQLHQILGGDILEKISRFKVSEFKVSDDLQD
jgi:hypothetical protein